ncbi:MAG: hypothetical protein ACK5UC_11670, partial [Planctomycetaceae bacterium]
MLVPAGFRSCSAGRIAYGIRLFELFEHGLGSKGCDNAIGRVSFSRDEETLSGKSSAPRAGILFDRRFVDFDS